MLIVRPPVPINPQTEPQAGPWVISGTHKPNQSVISFLYGIEQDDRMSGNTQGVRGSFGSTHASRQKKKQKTGTVALYWGWFGVELCSRLEKECNCARGGPVERIREPSSLRRSLSPLSGRQGTLYTFPQTEDKVHNHPTRIRTCRVAGSCSGMKSDGNVSKCQDKAAFLGLVNFMRSLQGAGGLPCADENFIGCTLKAFHLPKLRRSP